MSERPKKTFAEELYIALQPTRRKILEELKTGSRYIEQLAKNISEDRKNVSFHLLTLKEHGFVTGELGIIELPTHSSTIVEGRAGKFYSLTEKGEKAVETIERLIADNS